MGVLMGTGIFTLLHSQTTYSANENRTLTVVPTEISVGSVLKGDFQDRLTEALSDQFPAREKLLALSAGIRKTLGRRDLSGAYLGQDHYFFEKVTDSDIDWSNYRKNLDRIEQVAEKYPECKVSMMLIPSSGVILKDKLPANAAIYDAAAMYEEAEDRLGQVTLVNPTDSLRQAAEEDHQVYYRTDHHWTTYGARCAYLTWKEEADDAIYQTVTVTNSFYGTLYSKTLDASAIPDTIKAATINGTAPDQEAASGITVTINGETSTMYHYDKLEEKDKYQFFFGGNFGEVRIDGGSGEGTILVLKDSFANCFVPYLLNDYATVIMVDLRYYPGSLNSLIDTEQPSDMLVLYEMNNFANDTNQAKLSL